MTIREWSLPPKTSSARPAAHTASAAMPTTNAAPSGHDWSRTRASHGTSGSATSDPTVPDATGA